MQTNKNSKLNKNNMDKLKSKKLILNFKMISYLNIKMKYKQWNKIDKFKIFHIKKTIDQMYLHPNIIKQHNYHFLNKMHYLQISKMNRSINNFKICKNHLTFKII